jgi:hypothetical protein
VTEVPLPSKAPGSALSGAEASLVPVSRELDAVGARVRTGQLRLDREAAQRLLDELSAVRSRVETLITQASADGIDRSLRFGDNIVAHVMGDRLRGAASGGTDAAIPVLERFLAQLEKVSDIVSRAAGLVTDEDEEAAGRLDSIGRQTSGRRS